MNSNVHGFILVESLAIVVKKSSKNHPNLREKVWYSSQLQRWTPITSEGFILMQWRWTYLSEMGSSLSIGQHLQQNSKTWSESWFDMVFQRPRHNRDEFPRPMGFILQWISSECRTVNPSTSVEMNSRVQWGSLEVAQVSNRSWKFPIESWLNG